MKKYAKLLAAILIFVMAFGITGCQKEEESKEFSPKLDTDKKVTLRTTGFFGNFEALDQVTADFNQYYPNVEFSYEQVGGDDFETYLKANPDVDIMMTSQDIFDRAGSSFEEQCADLSKDVDVSDLDENMLKVAYHGKKLSAIPMGQNMYGLIVNTTLLEKEGLSVPTNYEEFVKVLKALKKKGYTPIQGPNSKVYAELMQSMAFDMILNDENLYKDLKAGKASAADQLEVVFSKLKEITGDGFIDAKVNENYPDDNYDQAILNFFQGDVPFWVCNTEKVSGMKKRESKSEAFKKHPFDYEYIYAPLGENGAYAYAEPWVGFSVNKDSEDYEYAMEFVRFLATKDEINQMADIKGIPSIAKEKNDVAIYKNVLNTDKTEMNCINKGKITPAMVTNWYATVSKYASGDFKTEKEAAKYFVDLCSK